MPAARTSSERPPSSGCHAHHFRSADVRGNEFDGARRGRVGIRPAVAAVRGLEITLERDARRGEFAGENLHAVDAVGIGGVAQQQLVLGPVERMNVEDGRGLPRRLARGKDLIERRAVTVPGLEVDFW